MENMRKAYIFDTLGATISPLVGQVSQKTKKTKIAISVEGDRLSVATIDGCAPTTAEVNTCFGYFVNEYSEKYQPISRQQYYCRYRFVYREGSSGAQDSFVELDWGNGFPTRVHIAHMSMWGKVNEGINCNFNDFLELCLCEKFLTLKDDAYVYDPLTDRNKMSIIAVDERDTSEEEGWTEPHEIADGCVPMTRGKTRILEPTTWQHEGCCKKCHDNDTREYCPYFFSSKSKNGCTLPEPLAEEEEPDTKESDRPD